MCVNICLKAAIYYYGLVAGSPVSEHFSGSKWPVDREEWCGESNAKAMTGTCGRIMVGSCSESDMVQKTSSFKQIQKGS